MLATSQMPLWREGSSKNVCLQFFHQLVTLLPLWVVVFAMISLTNNATKAGVEGYCKAPDDYESVKTKITDAAASQSEAGCEADLVMPLTACTVSGLEDVDLGCFRSLLGELGFSYALGWIFAVLAITLSLYHFARNRFPFGSLRYYQFAQRQRCSTAFLALIGYGFTILVINLLIVLSLGMPMGDFLAVILAAVASLASLLPRRKRLLPVKPGPPIMLRVLPPWHGAKSARPFAELVHEIVSELWRPPRELLEDFFNEGPEELDDSDGDDEDEEPSNETPQKDEHPAATEEQAEDGQKGQKETKSKGKKKKSVRRIEFWTSADEVMDRLEDAYLATKKSMGKSKRDFQVLLETPEKSIPDVLALYGGDKAVKTGTCLNDEILRV